MIRSSKVHTFYMQHLPSNRFPAANIANNSLGKTASNLTIYVPYYPAQEDVNYVKKHESPEKKGGLAFDTTKPSFKDMTGSGSTHADDFSFLHPFKVVINSVIFTCFLSFSAAGFSNGASTFI